MQHLYCDYIECYPFLGGIEQWKIKQKSQTIDNTDVSMTTSLTTNNTDDQVKEVKDKESKSKKRNTVSEFYVLIDNLIIISRFHVIIIN